MSTLSRQVSKEICPQLIGWSWYAASKTQIWNVFSPLNKVMVPKWGAYTWKGRWIETQKLSSKLQAWKKKKIRLSWKEESGGSASTWFLRTLSVFTSWRTFGFLSQDLQWAACSTCHPSLLPRFNLVLLQVTSHTGMITMMIILYACVAPECLSMLS